MHKFKCPFCETELTAEDYSIGSCVNCPSCDEVVVITDKLYPTGSEFEGYFIKDMIATSTISTTYSAVGVKKLMGQPVLLTIPSSFTRKQLGEKFSAFNSHIKKIGYLSLDELPEMIDGNFNIDNPYYVYKSHGDTKTLSNINVRAVFTDPYDALKVVRKLVIFLKRLDSEFGMTVQALKPEMICYYKNHKVHVLNAGLSQFAFTQPDLLQIGLDIWHPAYASPEFLETGEGDDVRTDIFSLGGILFYLLTGEEPTNGETLYNGDDLKQMNPAVPDSIISLFNKMYVVDVSERYSNYMLLLRDIDSALNEAEPSEEDDDYYQTNTMAFDMKSVIEEVQSSSGSGIDLGGSEDVDTVESAQHPLAKNNRNKKEAEVTTKKSSTTIIIIVVAIILVAVAAFFLL